MELKEKFNNYYYKYLGISTKELDNEEIIFKCNQRDKPINRLYFQHLIITNINDKTFFSISPKYYVKFRKYILQNKYNTHEQLINILDRFFKNELENYAIRKMYRMTLDCNKEILQFNIAIQLTKDILMENLKNKNDEEKIEIWNRKKDEVEQGRQYVIVNSNRNVSWCKVSDIDYGGGNLAVWTAPEFRKNGYGKEVVKGACKWCIDNDIIPIYWVDCTNTASLNLAESLGFKIQSEEIVVSTSEE